ncbi:Eco57I restriction-modification methylase domain-containing protein [Lutibacter flavus]|uniref:site-specific DNA-methyltransferase (adenine-specific) n=1 Tax=Lutibacter flavus TaxID=691689 RepID=A0A238YDS0_9FLAO|nr:N-6 DNA methylase [Lutibacter flavus]SNR69102.1 TaqI-like C-terminal specificity domain-containing protein [Lutibacter flavus]
MALFQTSVLKTYLAQQDNSVVERAYKKYTKYFHNATIQENIKNSKEEQYQAKFLDELFVIVLDYTLNPKPNFNITTEFKNQKGAGKADGAILKETKAIGVIELKGTNTKDLESIRKQAFDYKANQKGCVYVITSNFEKLRFYINDATEFLEFNLFQLAPEEFALMYLCLQKDNILNNLPLTIKEASLVEEDKITKQFYNDYSVFKRELFRDLVKRNAKRLKQNVIASEAQQSHNEDDSNELKALEKNVKLPLFKKSQKLIDRFLFIFFAEDRDLLPPNSTIQILDKWKADIDFGDERPLYNLFKQYFHFLDEGRKGTTSRAEIYAYNGGLFKPDAILDSLEIDDDLLYKHTYKLAKYDFSSQVDVNILGHIFENSLNEIESVNAEIEGGEFDKQKSKRKKDGVFYTPKYITKYIVENTVGKLCQEKKDQLGFKEEAYFEIKKGTHQNTKKQLLEVLDNYRAWLLQITICDPACGSGAFLNQALDFLIKEHRYIDELKAKVLGGGLILSDIENTILENNIYGVDLNEESVEIAKLSLWLRTAQPRRKLNDLSNNIKCGNSLIDSKTVAGDKAFNWQQEFPQIFNPSLRGGTTKQSADVKQGFDVIIGNPPYGAKLSESVREYITNNFISFQSNFDIYTSFIELASRITKESSYSSYIIPVSWQTGDKYNSTRKFIASNLKLEIGIKLPYDVFKDAYVDTGIYVFNNEKSEEYYSRVLEFGAREKFDTSLIEERNLLLLPSKFWMQLDSLKVVLNPFFYTLQPKIVKDTITLDDISDSIRGILPNSNDVSDDYIEGYKKYFTGYLGRYQKSEEFSWVHYSDNLREKPKDYSFFQDERIIIRRLINRQFRIMASLVSDEFVNKKDIYNLKITNDNYEIHYLLALINSKLFSFMKTKGSTTASKDDFSQLTLSDIRTIPVKKITVEEQEKFKKLVVSLLDLNKELNDYTNKFIKYFSVSTQIEKLTRKLENWHELDFADFIKELNKAIKKAGGTPLTKKDEFEWLELFEDNKKKAQELQTQINQTEKTIDQMVYKLYNLAPDEIEIIENS